MTPAANCVSDVECARFKQINVCVCSRPATKHLILPMPKTPQPPSEAGSLEGNGSSRSRSRSPPVALRSCSNAHELENYGDFEIGAHFKIILKTPRYYTHPPGHPDSKRLKPEDVFVPPNHVHECLDRLYISNFGEPPHFYLAVKIKVPHMNMHVWTNVKKDTYTWAVVVNMQCPC